MRAIELRWGQVKSGETCFDYQNLHSEQNGPDRQPQTSANDSAMRGRANFRETELLHSSRMLCCGQLNCSSTRSSVSKQGSPCETRESRDGHRRFFLSCLIVASRRTPTPTRYHPTPIPLAAQEAATIMDKPSSPSLSHLSIIDLHAQLAPITYTKGRKAIFTNWASTFSSRTTATFRPRNVQEVRMIVELARREGKELRASGSGHSPSDLVCTDGYILNIDAMDQLLKVSPHSILLSSAQPQTREAFGRVEDRPPL